MDTLADTLWQEFAVETEEHLQAVEPILSHSDPQRISGPEIAQLFRSFHSVKGLARALDVLGMEGVAHHAENLLGLVRDGRAALTPAVADLLLQSVDALKRLRNHAVSARGDSAADPALLSRLAAAFAQAGGSEAAGAEAQPVAAGDDAPLHEDPDLLAIFVEMVKSRGPELCTALSAQCDERAIAVDAAETLTHAAEVVAFDALSEGFGGLRDVLQRLAAAGSVEVDGAARQELLTRLGDIRLQIELVGEITGQDAGAAEFAAALAERIDEDRRRLTAAIGAVNERLRAALAADQPVAASGAAAEVAQLARSLQAVAAAQSLGRMAEILLLVEDLYSRVASGQLGPSAALADAADAVFARIESNDVAEEAAAELTAALRAPLISAAEKALEGEGAGRLVAGLHIPVELLAVLSDENLAELERGVGSDGLVPYEILLHLEADPAIAAGLIGWLGGEGRAITNRTVVSDGESWFEFLALSPLVPSALATRLLALDPERRCVKRVRRLTAAVGGDAVLDNTGGAPGELAGESAGPGAAANVIRVRGEVVDAFLDEIGEMRSAVGGLSHLARATGARADIARSRALADRLPPELRSELLPLLQEAAERDRRLRDATEELSGALSRLHQSALELRVVPVDIVFNRLPRVVRDLAQRQGKSVQLTIEGREVRIDKSMVEALADPLIHMVRNAVDHGIEPPDERRAAGKPERAQLKLRATQRGAEIDIEIADDGRGLDADAIRTNAVARGLVSAAQAAALGDQEAFQFIFAPGLSTAAAVTETSGRGVGMDVVLTTVRRFNGDIAIRSERGNGTTFTLTLPVSAALQTALIVRVNGQSLAIPERHVVAVAEIEPAAIRLVGTQRSILYREAVLPLYPLGAVLGIDGEATAGPAVQPVVVTSNGRQMIGLEVDAIEYRQELFLKDLHPLLARFPVIGAAAVLGDGRVVLVLEGEELIQLAARGIERRIERRIERPGAAERRVAS
jgi:two-component system chemotaxis sensor kinase CheA